MNREDRLQVSVMQWLKLALPADAIAFHPANGGSRNPIEGAKLKAMGVVAGAPDIVIFWNERAFCIELKTATGRQRPNQKEFEQRARNAGAFYQLCRSMDEVEGALLGWGFALRGRIAA